MSEVKRVLKPGGILLLSTPNDIEYAEGNHYHVHEFEYEELKLMVKKYFQHHTDYFQTLWMYSTILPLEMQISEWQKNIKTLSTVTLKPEQSIYFFMLCSDAKITATIEPQGVIGEHFRQRDLQRRNEERRKLQNEVKQLKENRQELRLHQVKLERQISEIHESKAWEFTRYLQKISKYLRLPFPK
jgi:SAM-dependent methyltransferase